MVVAFGFGAFTVTVTFAVAALYHSVSFSLMVMVALPIPLILTFPALSQQAEHLPFPDGNRDISDRPDTELHYLKGYTELIRLYDGTFDHQSTSAFSFSLGSIRSPIPSPSRLKEKAVNTAARPGASVIQGACRM